MAVERVTLLQDANNKLKVSLTNAVNDIDHMRGLLKGLYDLVETVNDDSKFKEWKISAGLFKEIDLDVGSTYWMRGSIDIFDRDWQLVRIDIDEIGNGQIGDKVVWYMTTTGNRIPLYNFNGLEYEFIKVEKPV
jgi:hypothetical protein